MKYRSAGGAEVVAHGQSHGLPQTPAAPATVPIGDLYLAEVTVQPEHDNIEQ
jgi:hypothetical protein